MSLSKTLYVNSYQNDDYLFVAGLLQEVRDIHKKIYYDVQHSKWVRGNSEIPYIQLNFIERPAMKRDEFGNWIPDDKKLNMGVKAPLPNGAYQLEFNYYWLKQYMKFLQTIFDSNEELVYEIPTDDPQYPILGYKRNELIYLWSVRILAIYISLSWIERNEDRVWTENTISEFIRRSSATHPIYQFRLFCTLNRIRDHLNHMAEKNKLGGYVLKTADNTSLDENLFMQVWERACDMIFSFEYAFRVCWNTDERTSLEKVREGLYIMEKAAPKSDKEIPFLMCYLDMAQKELESYEQQWPKILDKLNKYGMYFKMGK